MKQPVIGLGLTGLCLIKKCRPCRTGRLRGFGGVIHAAAPHRGVMQCRVRAPGTLELPHWDGQNGRAPTSRSPPRRLGGSHRPADLAEAPWAFCEKFSVGPRILAGERRLGITAACDITMPRSVARLPSKPRSTMHSPHATKLSVRNQVRSVALDSQLTPEEVQLDMP